MLEEYIKETVKKELAKQRLNDIYGKNSQELKQENKKIYEANSDLTEKLFTIESLINYYESFKPDYYALLNLVESIKNILKES